LRAECVPRACGEVVEIGIGSGLNLPFYSSDVQHVYGIDPSVELQRMARKRAAMGSIKVEFISRSAEEPLPFVSGSIDTVLVTWTLCSIPNALQALQQMKRILKPCGHLIFVEHGRSVDPGVVVWQDRLTPLWERIGAAATSTARLTVLWRRQDFGSSRLKRSTFPGHVR